MTQTMKKARLVLQDGSVYTGHSFGYDGPVAGEVVFNTGMVGYPETFTDPSYAGQILTLTFPMIGNYGIPRLQKDCEIGLPYESDRVQISGLIVSDYSAEYSHWDAAGDLATWLKESKVPALTGVDTRSLTKELREQGTMLGKIIIDGGEDVAYHDPNKQNLVAMVSPKKSQIYGTGNKRKVVMIDCGAKNNIIGELVARDMEVTRVPWDANLDGMEFDGVMVSNGPGDPKQCGATIHTIRRLIARKVPTFGICLGHQLLALAIGADTYKLKYGHRSQNQPVIEEGTTRCLITSQNHGFAVDAKALPDGWVPWFTNLNDGTNEGIRHESLPIRSAQFHPEAAPGPVDANYLFDQFATMIDGAKK